MTYQKIAQKANVSLSTVSKALSGSKEVSEDLREKIVRIAIDGGYFVNKSKRKIEYADKSAISVAIVCPEIVSVTYAEEITALKKEIEKCGAIASVYVYDFDAEKLSRILESITVGNRADGVILYPVDGFSLPSNPLPVIGISSASPLFDTVSCNVDEYFLKTVRYLKGLGHETLAFVGERYTTEKEHAYRRALERLGLRYDENNVYIENERFEKIGYAAAEKMLKKPTLPTAVICAYDEIALALIHCLTEHGIRIPEDVSVTGINDVPSAAYASVPLTTVHVYQNEKAEIAVKMLYDKIFGKSKSVKHVVVQNELIIRNSTAAPRKNNR